ncbi:MAG: chemotaxis-specific protein-glutamate methyltransferase CheB [Holophaga sp.]|jgi:two-component system chemotaxis response regulator CheB
MTAGKIDVLVAEDSTVVRMMLLHLLESDPQFRVIGAVGDGQAALDLVRSNKPDVVLMDIHMPCLNGFEATRRIMETDPVPIVICSATANPKDVVVAFQAMEAGAVACIEKPLAWGKRDFDALAANLLETLKLMSEVKVVRRSVRTRPDSLSASPPVNRPKAPAEPSTVGILRNPAPVPGTSNPSGASSATVARMIGIGASTGGPQALQAILAGLPKDFPVPLLIVQHIAAGFLPGLAEWLNQTAGTQVHIATQGTLPRPGHAYLAPDGLQMGIDAAGKITLTREPDASRLQPAVSHLFRALADRFGTGALGVLLSGMGQDGAKELKTMKDLGAITIAQDQESSVVHGMPGAAIELGGATHVLPVEKIASALINLTARPAEKGS